MQTVVDEHAVWPAGNDFISILEKEGCVLCTWFILLLHPVLCFGLLNCLSLFNFTFLCAQDSDDENCLERQ